ncbi:MAG: putative sulfate exporter family transporter [Bdellovibrionota bacterium]
MTSQKHNHLIAKILFPVVGVLLVAAPSFNESLEKMSAGLAVISGIILAVLFHNPYLEFTKKMTPKLLTWSVVGLGCGMNLITVAQVGMSGIGYTFISIAFTTILGLLLGFFLRNSRDTSVLVTFGTAICGGSAIAAIAPTIKAKGHEVSVALAIVFLLNAIALLVFPTIGHEFNLSQEQFGLWSALAIHDTSSVVGATLQYGKQALEVGTTVKLARALWIIPITLILSLYYSKYIFHKEAHLEDGTKAKKPWFILGFLLAAALVTWVPALKVPGFLVRNIAERVLILTLFCIGANLSRSAIKSVGIKPFVQGFMLWIITAAAVLLAIKINWI